MAARPARRAAALLTGALLLGAVGCGSAPPDRSAVSTAELESFFGGMTHGQHGEFGLDAARLVEAADAPGGRLLRVAYPAGSASRRAGGDEGGTQVYLRLPDGPVDALALTYQVRFPDGFDFVKGGKLPGLFGGTVTGGRDIPDGTNGFSTRYMWRRDGAGEVYAYLQTSQEHGTSLGRGCWTFPTGRWSTVRQVVRLNTPGAADGEVTVWQDGHPVLHQQGLEFRTVDSLRIDGLFFSTFFGGGDSSWASPVDQHADFAGFTVSTDTATEPVGTVAGGPGCTAALDTTSDTSGSDEP
jgi:hypothetical protein